MNTSDTREWAPEHCSLYIPTTSTRGHKAAQRMSRSIHHAKNTSWANEACSLHVVANESERGGVHSRREQREGEETRTSAGMLCSLSLARVPFLAPSPSPGPYYIPSPQASMIHEPYCAHYNFRFVFLHPARGARKRTSLCPVLRVTDKAQSTSFQNLVCRATTSPSTCKVHTFS